MEEDQIEGKVDKKFQKILVDGKADLEIKTKTEIRRAIKRMKNKKAGDKNKWKS